MPGLAGAAGLNVGVTGISIGSGLSEGAGLSPPAPGNGGGSLAATANQTSVTYNGVTFNFNTAVPVGQFVTGEPFVLSTSAFQITSTSPASADRDANSFVGHGMMRDPYITTTQGFDAYIGNGAGNGGGAVGAGMAATPTTYSAALNVDPAINGAIAISSGSNTSFVKSVRLGTATNPYYWQCIQKYVPLHVLSAAPYADAYPPSPSALTKTMWRKSQINTNALRSVAMPGSFTDTFASASAKVPADLGLYGSSGELLRRFRLDVATGGSTTNYSSDVAQWYARLMTLMHSSALASNDRATLMDMVVRFGIQIHGLTTRGWGVLISGNIGGAGQQAAIQSWLYMAAFLLSDSTLLAAARAMKSGLAEPFQWGSSSLVGFPSTEANGYSNQTWFDEQIGEPFILANDYASQLANNYGNIAAFASSWEHIPLLMLQNGPGGITGAQALLKGGAFNTTNQAAVSIAHLSKYRKWSPYVMAAWSPGTVWADLYDTSMPLSGLTAWTGRPEQLPFGEPAASSYDDDFFTAGSGSVSWNISAYQYATETVTSRDFRHSLDGYQWVETLGVAASGSKSGLISGAPHWCGLRQNSASGSGLWSANFPYASPITSGTDRGKCTPTGTPSNSAPAFTTNPVIVVRQHPGWGYKVWTPASGTLGVEDTEIACGVGYSSGYPAPAYSYQWRRNGTDIGGATSKVYNRVAADASTNLTCFITATNGSGSATYTTAAVTCPALTTVPAGTLIDTNFRGNFVIDYETEWNNTVSPQGATKVHLPTETLAQYVTGADRGMILCDKTGAYPALKIPMSRAAVAGQQYRVIAQLVSNIRYGYGAEAWDALGKFFVFNGNNSVTYHQTNISQGSPSVVDIDATFTVGAGETFLNLVVWWTVDTPSGGISPGDIFLTKLKLYAYP